MKTIQLILSSLLAVLLFQAATSHAEDIDIYSGTQVSGAPNVMIIIDNAANSNASMSACTYWDGALPTGSSQGTKSLDNYMCALDSIAHGMQTKADGSAVVNLGITTQAGVYLTLTPVDDHVYTGTFAHSAGQTNRQVIGAAVRALTDLPGNATQGTSFQETWAYYTGGNGGTTNVGIMSGTAYTGTNATTGCQKNYAIFISGVTPSAHANTNGSELTVLTAAANNAEAAGRITSAQKTAMLTRVASSTESPWAVEWARFMRAVDINTTEAGTGVQSIVTYSVAAGSPVYPAAMDPMEKYIYSVAQYGGGKYFAATSYSTIYLSILKILNEVQAVNSVFSSSSLPVSVNAQGTYLNQIYMGMFRPDPEGNPRWAGNLKQYHFVATRDSATHLINLSLGDSLDVSAINPATGFISPNAVSYWTCGGNPSVRACSPVADPAGGFWVNDTLKAIDSVGTAYDLPDGEWVDKGGAAQIVRLTNLTNNYTTAAGTATNPRKLYTYCPSGSGCVATLSDTTNAFDRSNAAITDALLGTGPAAISSITSAATVQGLGASSGGGGAPDTVSITALSKSGSTVTATVSAADLTKLSVGKQLNIASGATKYNCNPCTVATINAAANTFTYSKSGGSGSPTLPTTAPLFSSYFWIYKPSHGLSIGQTLTISGCTLYTALNGTIGTVAINPIYGSFYTSYVDMAVSISVPYLGSDAGCDYTINTATVATAAAHLLPTGAIVTIAGAAPAGYNGSWVINVTGATTFTYQYTAAAPLANFAAAGATVTSSSTTRDALTRWVRGEDNFGDEAGPGGGVTIRPSLHGDVLHSRPVTLNYGGATGVVAYYGGNDGVFRAINGNQTEAIGAVPAGGELWGFIPTEFYGKLKRLHDNSPILDLPSVIPGIVPTPQKKDYFADGSTGVYQKLNADGTTNTAYIYFSMRRGGKLIYALNVTDPASPRYLWKITNTGDFTELGQTWSTPKVAVVDGYANPVLIFGAGYDTAEDSEPPGTNTMGRGIYIVDAVTGVMVWRATYGASSACSGTAIKAGCTVLGMNYSIPADITLLDRDNDGKIDRLYAVDVGGNVWRVDLKPTAAHKTPDFWQVTKLAELGCNTGAAFAGKGTCSDGPPRTTPRKFFYAADVVPTTTFDAVIVGQGDREHPLATDAAADIRNRIYMLKDINTGDDGSVSYRLITRSKLFDATSAAYLDASPSTGDATTPNWGFYVKLGDGEKVVNAPLTVAGYTYFGTNQPTESNTCSANLGIARGYRLKPLTGTLTSTVFAGGGLPPSPVAGVVSVTVAGDAAPTLVPFVIGGGGDPACVGVDCSSALGGAKPTISVPTTRFRTYWYQEMD